MKRFLWAVFGVLLTGNAFAFDAYRSACSGDFCTAEFEKMNGLTQIGADLAYETLAQYGKTAGQGVTVAVVDSGILLTHPEFSGKISGLQGSSYNGVALNPVWGDHGTHVAGIIGAAKDGSEMHGVAYGTALLGFSAIGCGDTACLDTDGSWQALASSTFNDVKISNNSWGWGAWSLYAGSDAVSDEIVQLTLGDAQKLAAENKLIVAAASNDTMLSPNVAVAGLPYYDSSVRNNIVSVVAYDPTKKPTDKNFLAYFSNLAYKAEDWSIAAPGMNIYSTVANPTDDYGYYDVMQGTSMASPMVAGAAAVVSSAFPFLNGKQLADTLLSNAYKLDSSNAAKYYEQYNILSVEDGQGGTSEILIPVVRYVIMSGSGPSEAERAARVNSLKTLCAGCKDVQVFYNNQLVSQYDENGNLTFASFDGNYLSYESVFGNGLLDLDSSVKGLKTFDANRLSASDYDSDKNQWYYTINVDAGEEGLPFRHDISETKHKTLHTGAHVGLRKTGSGELQFAGTQNWKGDTVIDAGTLYLTRTGNLVEDVYISQNGVLAGTGSVGGSAVYNNGGTIMSSVTAKKIIIDMHGKIYFNKPSDLFVLTSGYEFKDAALAFNTDNLESGTFTLIKSEAGAITGNLELPTYDDIIFYDFAYNYATDGGIGQLNVKINRYHLDDDEPYETPLSDGDKAVAAALDRQIQNGNDAFKAYYLENEEGIKNKIHKMRSQVQSVSIENMPLANRINDNVNSRLFNLARGYMTPSAAGRRGGGYRPAAYRGRSAGATTLTNKVWVQGIGGKAYVDANKKTGTAKIESTLFGGMMGFDFEADKNLVFGFTAGYAKSKNRQEDDKMNIQDWRGGVYFSAKRGMFSLNGIALGGYQDYKGVRRGGVSNDTDLQQKYNGWSAEGGLNLGVDLYANGNPRAKSRYLHMRPYVAANYARKHQGAFTETGDDAFALHIGDATDTSVKGQTGVMIGFGGPRFEFTLDAAYQHLLKGDAPQVSAYFASDVTRTAFTSTGELGDKDFFVLGGGFDIRFTDGFSMNVWADNRFSDNTRSHTGMITLKWHF